MKECITCGILKDYSEFHANLKHSDGLQTKCKDCSKDYAESYYIRTMDKFKKHSRNSHYKKFGMTYEKVQQEKLNRDYKCDICRRQFEDTMLVPDHCHKTMTFRGILCYQCNNCLGWYESNIEATNEYLK